VTASAARVSTTAAPGPAPLRGRIGAAWELAGRVCLLVLAATLPFELKTPWLSLGWVVVTNAELALYATLGCWAVWRLVAGRGGWTRAHAPILAIVAAMLVSALLAPVSREAALKFALRSAGGGLLALAAIDLLTTPRRVTALAGALVAGSVVSAAAGVLEVQVAGAQMWLLPFKTQPTFAAGFLRASGPSSTRTPRRCTGRRRCRCCSASRRAPQAAWPDHAPCSR
jgi:hypothetical protein